MSEHAEKVGEEIASVVTEAIEAANAVADDRAELAEEILDAAMETHRGEQIRSVEEDVSECLQATASLAQTVEALALQVAEMSGALSTLQASPPMIALPQQSEEEAVPPVEVEIVEPETVEVETPAPATEPPAKPRGKRHLWI